MEDVLTGFPNSLKDLKSNPKVAPQSSSVVISPDRKRSIYTQALANRNINRDNAIISEGYIRVEEKIVNGKGNYKFNITRDTFDQITERKLDRNDKFLVTEIGIFLMRRLETQIGVEVLQTYPNEVVFQNGVEDQSFNYAHLESIYNGSLAVKVGQTKFIEGMDLLRFRNVPQSQESANIIFSQHNGKVDGFCETTPQILLSGDEKHEIEISIPVDANTKIAHTANNTNNYLVLMCRGLLISSK